MWVWMWMKPALWAAALMLLAAAAQGDFAAEVLDAADVYAVPGQAPPAGTLEAGAAVVLEGRTATGAWLLAHTPDGALRGWVERRQLRLAPGMSVAALPIVGVGGGGVMDALTVYAGPSATSEAIAQLPQDAQVRVEGRSFTGAWLLVQAQSGVRGWVEARQITLGADVNLYDLQVVNTAAAPVPPAALTLRTGPGEDYPDSAIIPYGARLRIEGRDESGAWLLVYTPDTTNARGWMPAADLTLDPDASIDALAVIEHPVIEPLPAEAIVLRAGPGFVYPIRGGIPWGARVVLEGRNAAADWLLIHQSDTPARRGWVPLTEMTLDASVALADLRLLEGEIIGAEPPEEAPPAADAAPASEVASAAVEPPPYSPSNASYDALVAHLYGVPPVPAAVSYQTRQIYRQGQREGLRAGVFSKVGDCQTAHLGFLHPFGVGEYDLGPYAYLQSTLDYFSATSPREGVSNAFENASFAAVDSFNAAAVLDPTWANPAYCRQGESPLACEYRVVRPSVAIIMLGTMDVLLYGPETFEMYLRKVVNETTNRGIVPVLTTFPSSEARYWEQSLRFNAVIVKVAQEKGTPVINLWLAARALPNYGLAGDHKHLSYKGERRLRTHGPDDRWMAFTGDEEVWGQTLRNLLTLQTLDLLRQNLE